MEMEPIVKTAFPYAVVAVGVLLAFQGVLMIVAYTVLLPSVISQVLYVRGVEMIGSNRASLFINLIPIFGTIGSVLVLGERLEGFHLVAAALVIIGIVLAELAVRRR